MRSFLVAVFALAFASSTLANPEPEPHVARPPVCKGWTPGWCATGLTCQKGSDNKYSCKPPVCGSNYGTVPGTCPTGKSCVLKGRIYECVAPRPAPSGKSNKPWKRSAFCTDDSIACPVKNTLHGFECVDVKSNIEQCGDCAVLGGVDCSALPGVDKVACVNGACRVEGCVSGFVFDFRKRTCVPTSNTGWKIQPDQQ
ncbi:hypothetical protein JCM3765_006369 [Sporobolomyces pararoseus]